MKKETVNTFEGGMIRDLHPLTTPPSILTDALNATFLTYNGNERMLQNDMGNEKVGTAYLASGYVPVGMKEHGGIVYVAAYNPSTGCGQIGSFPSPQQLWEGDPAWTVNSPPGIEGSVSISLSSMYSGDLIIEEIQKQELFRCGNNLKEAREFHPGDRYVLKCDVSTIDTYVKSGALTLQLGVIKNDGGIEIIKEYSRENPISIFTTTSLNPSDALVQKQYDVFHASSSGKMILIVIINTIDSFNLNRTYKLVDAGNGKVQIAVELTGEGTINEKTISTISDTVSNNKRENLKLYINSDHKEEPRYTIYSPEYDPDDTSPSLQRSPVYTIYPSLPYGGIKRMMRKVCIDFDKIRKNQDDFNEWRFFVAKDYIKIGWAYEFYNLDESKKLISITMKFYDFKNPGAEEPDDTITFYKDYFSGNFEDYIRFAEHTKIKWKHIYMVEIIKNVQNEQNGEINSETVTWKMLYVSPYYNKLFNSIYDTQDFTSNENWPYPVQYETPQSQSATISLQENLDYKVVSQKAQVKGPVGDYAPSNPIKTTQLNKNMYTYRTDTVPQGVDNHDPDFTTKLINEYEATITINGDLTYNDDIIGTPDPNLINNLLDTYDVESITLEKENNVIWENTTDIHNLADIDGAITAGTTDLSEKELEVKDNTLTATKLKAVDTRYIQGKCSNLKTTPYKSVGFKPFYSPDLSYEDKMKIAPFWNSKEGLLVISGEENSGGFKYNSTYYDGGNIVAGADTGVNRDNSGLTAANQRMGNPTVNIFACSASEAQDGSLGLKTSHAQSPTWKRWQGFKGWTCSDNAAEIDNKDNWAAAVWKFTDGNCRLVNLFCQRTWPLNGESWTSSNYPGNGPSSLNSPEVRCRIDRILRCVMSQLFIAKSVTKSASYVTTDPNVYRYQSGNSKLKIKLKKKANAQDVSLEDIMYVYDIEGVQDLDGLKLSELAESWNINTDANTIEVNGTTYENFINLIPQLDVTAPDLKDELTIDIDADFGINSILTYYLGLDYAPEENSISDIGKIKVPNYIQQYNNIKNYCKNGNLEASTDGTVVWTEDLPEQYLTEPLTGQGYSGAVFLLNWWQRYDGQNYQDQLLCLPYFGSTFITTAEYEGWTQLSNEEDNTILAKYPGEYISTKWVENNNHDGPDIYVKTLYINYHSLISN